MEAAGQNRELNVRAYQDELVETQDVIQAQLMESFMQAQFQKVLFDHIESRFRLDLLSARKCRSWLNREDGKRTGKKR